MEIYNSNKNQKLNKRLYLIFIALQTAIIVFLSSIFVLPYFVHAWETSQKAEAVCVVNQIGKTHVNIKVTFTNKDDKAMNVVAKDNWTTQEVNLGRVNPTETKSDLIKTGQTEITNSSVTFFLKWVDGSDKEEITVKYNALNCKPVEKPTTTPQPTATPVPSVTTTATPTTTPIPTVTPTPTTAAQVVNNITNTNTVSANATATNTVNIQQVQPTPTPQVLAAKTVKTLPATGASDVILLTLLSLLPAGVYISKKAEKILT